MGKNIRVVNEDNAKPKRERHAETRKRAAVEHWQSNGKKCASAERTGENIPARMTSTDTGTLVYLPMAFLPSTSSSAAARTGMPNRALAAAAGASPWTARPEFWNEEKTTGIAA